MNPPTTGGGLQKSWNQTERKPSQVLPIEHKRTHTHTRTPPPMIMEFLTKMMPESQPEPGKANKQHSEPEIVRLRLVLNPTTIPPPSHIINIIATCNEVCT